MLGEKEVKILLKKLLIIVSMTLAFYSTGKKKKGFSFRVLLNDFVANI